MALLRGLTTLFLLPGTLALGALNVPVESDAGVLRSLINMIFWGIVVVLGALPFMLG